MELLEDLYRGMDDDASWAVPAPSSSSLSSSSCLAPAMGNAVWFLSLIQHDAELMYTTSRLYLHLVSQFEKKRQQRSGEWETLQSRQEQELAAMLDVADVSDYTDAIRQKHRSAASTSGMVVDCRLTETLFARHQREVMELSQQHAEISRTLEQEANLSLLSFLFTAAPEHLKHAIQQHNAQRHTTVDAMMTPASTPNWHQHHSVSHYTGDPPVDVLVLRIVNPLRGLVVGARPKDPSLASIIMECSPCNRLRECNSLSLSAYIDELRQEQMAKKVSDHLCRLAATKLSMLLVICDASVSEDEVWNNTLSLGGMENGMSSSTNGGRWSPKDASADPPASTAELARPSPIELVLPLPQSGPLLPGDTSDSQWTPLHETELKLRFTTRLYAGNIVVLWRCDLGCTSTRIDSRCRTALRDAMHLSIFSGVTRCSVVVHRTFGTASIPASQDDGQRSSTRFGPATYSGHTMVLRQLHHVLADIQMSGTCAKPPSTAGLHISGLLNGLAEWRGATPVLFTAVGRVPFNLPIAVRVFLDWEPLEEIAAEAFGRDVEVVARTTIV